MPIRRVDQLPSIRAKLGSVIVFAVAASILMMYVALGFAFRKSERDREFRELLRTARTVAALGFSRSGTPTDPLGRVARRVSQPIVVVDAYGNRLVGDMTVPSTVNRALDGNLDAAIVGEEEYLGVPVVRRDRVVGAVYLSHSIETDTIWGAVVATANFVRSVWWQLLLAGALAGVIALAFARFLARGMTQPLRDMAAAADRMARGDYSRRVRTTSRDEVGRLAEAFNRMAAEVEGLERLRRDLVANVSHELKTPISALRARLENLLDGVERPDPQLLSVMLQQTERLGRLVEQLLELSRLESGDVPLELEPVELAPLVARVLGEVEAARPDRGIAVSTSVAPDLPPVEADRERVHQVLFNLLDNAFRFTPRGGQVSVRAVRENGACEVSVEDTGPGIPDEHIALVFERFYRVDPSRSRDDGGTGIGLAIARSVVEAHGGRIWAESDDGRGSTFRFVLPLEGPTGAAHDGERTNERNRSQTPGRSVAQEVS